jgi:hypothetical protein
MRFPIDWLVSDRRESEVITQHQQDHRLRELEHVENSRLFVRSN